MKSYQKKIVSHLLYALFCISLAMFLTLSFANESLAYDLIRWDPGGTDLPGGRVGDHPAGRVGDHPAGRVGDATIPNPLGTDNIVNILENIVNFLIVIGAPILAIMILIGGFQILTAGGDPEKVKVGGNTILYSVIGYTIILCSWGIIYIIQEILN